MSETLGPYELQKRIGAGGMADVFLARGPQGVCVIKRPHAHLCANPEFVRMFLDEAAILAQLHHPNIAQIFDLGTAQGAYYLAMEYVPGFDLMTISLEHERQGELMAAELCARIVADVAGALHFAHEAKDRAGHPLHIVHRDVSPHNVLLSSQGIVKLIDFGVARTATGTHRTQAGLVKGKYPYMSPEQITGGEIDRRVDVYALGLVLYELLTNTRAIPGTTEVEQIDAARSARIRPIEQLRPNVTMPIRQILGGCLHPDPGGRYATALAVKEDLEKYLSYERHVVGQEDLLRLFRVVAAESGHLSPTDPSIPSRLTEQEQPVPLELHGPESIGDVGFSATQPSMKQPSIDSRPGATQQDVGAISLTQQIARPASNTKWVALGVVLVLAAGVFSLTQLRMGSTATDPAQTPPVAVEPAKGAVEAVPDAGVAAVAVADPPVSPENEVDAGGAAAAVIDDAPARAAVVIVDIEPPSDVLVDGTSYKRLNELELVPGSHRLVFENKELGFRKQMTIELKAGERRNLRLRFGKGTARIHIDPFATQLKIDGVVVQSAPSLKEAELWEGTHTFEASVEGKKKSIKLEVKRDALVDGTINLVE